MLEIDTIILAGGAGTRMRPLSLGRAKCMISFMGKPLAQYLVNSLRLNGLSSILFTSSGRSGEIVDCFGDGQRFDVRTMYYGGEGWHGTAGTVRNIVHDGGYDVSDPFVVVYGDSLLKADYACLLNFHRATGSCCTVLYHRPRFELFLYDYHDGTIEPSGKRTNYGVMDVAADGRITKVVEKPRLEEIKTGFGNPVANAAVYVLNRGTLDFVPAGRSFDFPKDLFPLLLEECAPCFGFDIAGGYRIDIGTIPNYFAAHFDALERRIDFTPSYPMVERGIWVGNASKVAIMDDLQAPVLVCEGTTIGPSTTIHRSVIGNNVRVGQSCSIEQSIVLDNVRIGDGAELSRAIIGDGCSVREDAAIGPDTVVAQGGRLEGVLFPRADIGGGDG